MEYTNKNAEKPIQIGLCINMHISIIPCNALLCFFTFEKHTAPNHSLPYHPPCPYRFPVHLRGNFCVVLEKAAEIMLILVA